MPTAALSSRADFNSQNPTAGAATDEDSGSWSFPAWKRPRLTNADLGDERRVRAKPFEKPRSSPGRAESEKGLTKPGRLGGASSSALRIRAGARFWLAVTRIQPFSC